MRYFADLGFNRVSLPFRWERLQPILNADLSPLEQGLLEATVFDITRRGLAVVLDPHNYARRRIGDDNWAEERLIGSTAVPTETFIDLWYRLAMIFKNNDRVIFGLMNEPFGVPAMFWPRSPTRQSRPFEQPAQEKGARPRHRLDRRAFLVFFGQYGSRRRR